MRFAEVINQDAVKKHLREMISENRLSHALFFLARDGAGGLPLARAFAQYIVCEKSNPAAAKSAGPSLFGDEPETITLEDSCGVCPACIKASQLVHPDIHFTFPVIPNKPNTPPVSADFITPFRTWAVENPYSNSYEWLQYIAAENKQGNITAKECEVILHNMSLKSFESTYKIQIIWMPEALGKEGNKLLKVIEEPPPNTVFILVAENDELVLPTILSRVQLIKIPALTTDDITSALISRESVPEETARKIAGMSDGSYLEALQILQHQGDDWDALLKEWMNSIVRTGPVAQLKIIDEIARIGREKQKQLLRYFIQILQHALHISILGSQRVADKESENVHEFAEKLQRFLNTQQLEAIVHELDKSSYYIERNAHAKVTFHALTIKLYHIISDKSLILVK
jgi:DNA polymerase-3 subunit delta'